MTGWDRSPPGREERAVGRWDVTPIADGVAVEAGQRVRVPEGIKEQLRAEAEQAGAPASKTFTLRYQHGQDTRETQSRTPGRSPADLAAALRARNGCQQDGELDPKYQKLLDRVLKAKEQQPRGRPNRRAGRSSQREKRPDYSLPQIVVVQESASGRRVGGL